MNKKREMKIVHHRSGWPATIFGILLIIGGVALLFTTWWGAAVIAIGAVLFICARWVSLVVDKQTQEVTITTKGWLKTSTIRTHPFASIKEIVVVEREERRRSKDGRDQIKITYTLNFYKHNGEMDAIEVPSSGNFTIGGMAIGRVFANNKVMDLANRIADTIGVPCRIDRNGRLDVVEAIGAIKNAITSSKSNSEQSQTVQPSPVQGNEKTWGSQ